jgi:hypothetical protein
VRRPPRTKDPKEINLGSPKRRRGIKVRIENGEKI